MLFHDYPLFLLSYHYAFCDIIPAKCIQLRNLVLSAFPTPVPAQYDPKRLFIEENIHEKLKNYREMFQAPQILTKYKVITLKTTTVIKPLTLLLTESDMSGRIYEQTQRLS